MEEDFSKRGVGVKLMLLVPCWLLQKPPQKRVYPALEIEEHDARVVIVGANEPKKDHKRSLQSLSGGGLQRNLHHKSETVPRQ